MRDMNKHSRKFNS